MVGYDHERLRGERPRVQAVIPSWRTLGDDDRGAFWSAVDFLKSRLAEPDTVEWALRLRHDQRIERMAISHLLDSTIGPVLEELQEQPWVVAWRLIQESWSQESIEEHHSVHVFDIGLRLHAGDRSGPVVTAIVSLVAPRLKVEPIDSFTWSFIKKPRRPRTLRHLLSASLTSGRLLNLDDLGLSKLKDTSFLVTLANALDASVSHGLDMARRIGWDGASDLWQLGSMHRVRYARYPHAGSGQTESDVDHRGIAPSVKLLHAVVARMSELEPASARPFVQRWRVAGSPIHIRLWSEPMLNRVLISAQEVEEFFRGLDQRQFWDLNEYPEIAELRALRFGDLELEAREAIVRRIHNRPPYHYWPREVGREAIKDARMYWAVREAKRIEVAGGELPTDAKSWLGTEIKKFPDLAEMSIDGGLPASHRSHADPSNPDDRFDKLHGITRLRFLQTALSSGRDGTDYPGALSAGDWLARPENAALVLSELESTPDGGDEFPIVWRRLVWTHAPTQQDSEKVPERDLRDEGQRVLRLLEKLSESTLSATVAGICNWLMVWSPQVITSAVGLRLWLRIWPIAVSATNEKPQREQSFHLSVLSSTEKDEQGADDFDTLNSPVGKLLSAFLSACPSLAEVPKPFRDGTALRAMRDAVIDCTGRSALISRYRLLEKLRYFLDADSAWAKHHLVAPLLSSDDACIDLWPAVARGPLFSETLKIIGNAMVEKVADLRLGRETRTRLVFSLVVESLHAFRESREPSVPNARVQQMLRSVDDEIRSEAADTIRQFVAEMSKYEAEDDPASAASGVLSSSAAPFLGQVWPQERSLATPGVSRALARLPATSGEAFADAVDAIGRFLVPFECWSMLEYGLYGDDRGVKKLSIINDEIKAEAFLRLLDLTVGTSDDATIPHGLADALDQMRYVSRSLMVRPEFRRLAAAARR